MAKKRIEARKRGAATRRRSATSSNVRGITTSAIESGVAIAAMYAGQVIHSGNLSYAVDKTGDVIFNRLEALKEQQIAHLSKIPCVVGKFDRDWLLFQNAQQLQFALNTVSLYNAPIEFQFISQEGVCRFCVPYSQEIDIARLDIQSLVAQTMGVSGNTPPEQKHESFFASAQLVETALNGESYFVPWGVHPYGVQ